MNNQTQFLKTFKSLFFLMICFLSSCSAPSSWQLTQLESTEEHVSKLKFTPKAKTFASGDLIFTKTDQTLQSHIELHGGNPFSKNTKQVILSLIIDDAVYSSTAQVHLGGQKITIPRELEAHLLKALQENKTATLLAEGYKIEVLPENFSKFKIQ